MTSRFQILIGLVSLVFAIKAGAAPATTAVALPADEPPPSDVADAVTARVNTGPLIVVPPLGGITIKKGAAAHKLLIEALEKAVGPRVVPAIDALQAQNSLGLVAADFETSVGLEKYAQFLTAERAVTVAVADSMTTVRVYASLTGAPPLVLELPRKKRSPLDEKWATATATAIATRAEDALAARIEAPTIDLTAPVEASVEPVVEPPPAELPSLPSLPALVVAVGGGVALRDVEVSGPLASKVVPMNQGLVPSVSAHIAFRPLVLSAPTAWWNDLLIEAQGRRGIVDATAGDISCTVDDDEISAALSWRARISDNPLVPRIGAGVSASLERFLISGCSLPVLSTSTTQAAGFARLGWNVLPGLVDIDVLGGVRVPVVGEGSSFERPGVLGQFAVNATPIPALSFLFVRAVARVAESRLTQGAGPDLVVNDLRSSFELQLGGAL